MDKIRILKNEHGDNDLSPWDFYQDGSYSIPIDEWVLKKEPWIGESENSEKMRKKGIKAKVMNMYKEVGNNDLRHGPRVVCSLIPHLKTKEEQYFLFFVFKEENNGTTYVFYTER